MSWHRVEVTKYADGSVFAYAAFSTDEPFGDGYPRRDGIVTDYVVQAGSIEEAEAKGIELRKAGE